MRLDIIVYSERTAIGFVYLQDLLEGPVVAYYMEGDNGISENHISDFSRRSNFCIKDESIVTRLQTFLDDNLTIINDEGNRLLAEIYAVLIKDYSLFEDKDSDFYELACCSNNELFIKIIYIYLLEHLLEKGNRIQFYKLAKNYTENNNPIGYLGLAMCYQKGFIVRKNLTTMYELMKKAAELQDPGAIGWMEFIKTNGIEKQDLYQALRFYFGIDNF